MKNIIIVGLGFMGGMHAQIYQQLENATLVGVIDLRVAETQKRLAELGLPQVPVYPTLKEALEKASFDVLDICLPTDLHPLFALDGIAAGKAVFCEKPLALSNADAQKIRDAAEQAGVPFQVGHCIRFWPEYQALREFHASGRGGRLLSLSMTRRASRPSYTPDGWLNEEVRSNGAAFDLHIHDTDFILALLGKPHSVSSRATFDASGPSHIFTDYAFDGVVVHAEGGWNYPDTWGFNMAFQAVYEDAVIDYDSGQSPTLRITRQGEATQAMPFTKTGGESSIGGGNISDLGGYYNEIACFIERLESGNAIEDATAEQAALSVRVTLAEIESARSGRAVQIG